MPLNEHTLYNLKSDKYYIDTRHMQDDKTILENPHKGWYYHYVDNGFYDKRYRSELCEEEYNLPVRGIHHLYIRFDWRDIEKEKGVYDWSVIDKIINKFSKSGYKFSLRMCTFEGSGIKYAIPDWLAAENINGTWCKFDDKETFEPDYSDEYFLSELEKFMIEYGKKFSGNPLIEYIDIGTFGTWGEGHTYSGSMKHFSFDTIKRHINMHLKYFPDTLIMLNDDFINHLSLSDPKMASEMYDYCIGKNMGMRDDGICVKVFCDDFGFSTLRSPCFFDDFAKNAPVDLELQHYPMCAGKDFANGYRFYEAMKEAQATFAGFHGYISEWIRDNPDFHAHCANKLGYWYFIEGIHLPELVSGTRSDSEIVIRNKGFARAYHKFDIKIRLSGNNETYILNTETPDNRRWMADSINYERILLDLRNVPTGEYMLEIGLFENTTPIKLGFDSQYASTDGYYSIKQITVSSL